MSNYLNIGPSPAGEDCVQVGSPNYRANATLEMKAYIEAIREKCGPEPDGASLQIKWFAHDMGSYGEVVCVHDDTDTAIDYAYMVEGDAPQTWEETSIKRPRFDDAEFEKTELIPVPENGRKWLSDIPTVCEIKDINYLNRIKPCEGEIKNEFVDGATVMGPWANMCPTCQAQFGTGIGLGMGQRYKRAVDGNFYKVE